MNRQTCWITFQFQNPEDWRIHELALSVLCAARHYHVRVVTNLGERIRQIGLPCTVVDRTFVPAMPWSVHKLRTYADAPSGEPFLHIDSDVFLFDPLPEWLFEKWLFAQSPEGKEHYLLPMPAEWAAKYEPKPHSAWNMGIFGGNPGTVREYARFALESAELWPTAKPTYVEQLVLGKFSQVYRFAVASPLIDGKLHGYTHLMDDSRNTEVQHRIRLRLCTDYPVVAERLGIRRPMLSILVSRGRVKRLMRAVESWLETRTMADMVVVLDEDDPEAGSAISALSEYRVRVERRPRVGFAQAFDQACRRHSRGYDVIGMAANDLVFCTRGWDKRFYDELLHRNFMGVVYGRDGRWDKDLATHPYIGSRLFEAAGTIVTPEQRHLWVDNNLMELGKRTNLIYIDDVLIRHDHYGVMPNLTDDAYLACNSRENYDHDRECHERYAQTVREMKLWPDCKTCG